MENAGIKVATVSSASRETRRGYIAMLGKILGKEDRAQGFLDWEDAVFADIAATLKGGPNRTGTHRLHRQHERQRVRRVRPQEAYFAAGGLRNAAAEAGFTDGSVKVGAETLLAWNPDIILVNYYNDSIKPEDILEHPVLAGLDAVKQGRVYKTPAIDPATSAGGELAYLWFAEIGYPELFHTDVRKAIDEGFARLYKEADAAQIDGLLQMSGTARAPAMRRRSARSHSCRTDSERDRRPARRSQVSGRGDQMKDIGFVTSGDGAQLKCYR